MIPIKDLNPSRTLPYFTYGLIAINVMVFLYQAGLTDEEQQDLFLDFAVKPAFVIDYVKGQRTGTFPELTQARDRRGREVIVRHDRTVELTFQNSILPLITCMFLHGGIGHIFGNMW